MSTLSYQLEQRAGVVTGGSSGIGTTAIMLAKAFGADIIVTAGAEDKLDACVKLGADLAINYRMQDFVEEVKRFTNGAGVDLILDMIGGPYVQRNLECAAMDGRIVQIAFQQGYKIENFDMRPISAKRIMYTGSTLRPRTIEQKGAIAEDLFKRVWPLFAQGKCRPVIDSTFPLRDVAKAHSRMEEGHHIGNPAAVAELNLDRARPRALCLQAQRCARSKVYSAASASPRLRNRASGVGRRPRKAI